MFTEYFWILAFLPIAILLIARFKWPDRITWIEMGASMGICVMLLIVAWSAGRYSAADSTEVWNGQVSNKDYVQQYCQTGWRTYQDSFCTEYRTRSVYIGERCDANGKNCYSEYQTEYKYDYSWERKWFVYTNLPDYDFQVARVDDQGAYEPPRWTSTQIGDPVSKLNTYSNWVRANALSVFYEDAASAQSYMDQGLIPEYPRDIYDLYNLDRVLQIGANISDGDMAKVNKAFSYSLGILGPSQQMNAVMVIVHDQPANPYIRALRAAWSGFEKNDAVIVLTESGGNLTDAAVLSWSKNDMFNVVMRDTALDMVGTNITVAATDLATKILDIGTSYYERRSMKEFEYLKAEIPVPTWLVILMLVIGIGGGIGLTYVSVNYDVFNGLNRNARY